VATDQRASGRGSPKGSIRSVLLAVPTMGGTLKTGTALTLVNLTKALVEQGYVVDLHNVDSADIVTARDIYGNMLLHSERWNAMLFVDADMEFQPQLIFRMLALDVDLAGVACTKRSFDIARFAAGIRSHGDEEKAAAEASVFNVMADWDEAEPLPRKSRAGFRSVAAVGMACVLVSRRALQAMVEEQVVAARADLRAPGDVTCWSFFGQIDWQGSPLTEDYSFCHRWTKLMKRDLWVCVDERIGHIGNFAYSARLSALG
jgi:hypothetical protein